MGKARVLITGADGFIGSHLTEAMVRQGYTVRALALYNSFGTRGHLDSLPQDVLSEVEILSGDIRDPGSARAAVKGCDIIQHLAALIAIPYSYVAPDSYVDTNIRGSLNLLMAARELGVSRFVQTSTSEVYGTAQYVPIDEAHPLNAQSPYAATKIGADQLAISFQRSFDMPVAVIRPFNTFGPRQSTRAVLPTIITQIAAGQNAIRLGNLSATRDFCYVRDTVDGFIAVAESDAAIGEVTNIGSGFEISIGDAANLIAQLMGRTIAIDVDDRRLRPTGSEVERLWAATDKAQRITSWRPAYAGRDGFARGMQETIAWFSNSKNLERYDPTRYQL
ncbi:NAD-dependent 4,6-dehydratase LegB [Dongia sp.]|uniref:NAD-dependent 4,6-dehydratase LegB n=1 Tax=Dongia sp. TaxID=1977262 RepID=UPI0035AE9019